MNGSFTINSKHERARVYMWEGKHTYLPSGVRRCALTEIKEKCSGHVELGHRSGITTRRLHYYRTAMMLFPPMYRLTRFPKMLTLIMMALVGRNFK